MKVHLCQALQLAKNMARVAPGMSLESQLSFAGMPSDRPLFAGLQMFCFFDILRTAFKASRRKASRFSLPNPRRGICWPLYRNIMIFFVQDIISWRIGTAATHFGPSTKVEDMVVKVGYNQF